MGPLSFSRLRPRHDRRANALLCETGSRRAGAGDTAARLSGAHRPWPACRKDSDEVGRGLPRDQGALRPIRELLQDEKGDGLTKALYDHPLLYGLFKGTYDPAKTRNLPSYIPSKNFAVALLDIVARGPSVPT